MINISLKRHYQSWGRYPKVKKMAVKAVKSRDQLPDISAIEGTVLPFGYGRTYGDACLNEGGTLLDASYMRHFISFDEEQGILRCEAGVLLAEILDLMVPKGWFLPTSPGTKFVSIGGAIGNDVHGKNHHRAGTFGRHVVRFELLRSNGERLICSPDENSDLFSATIGGLGLTGLILWADIRLRRIPGPYISKEQIRFTSIDEYFEITEEADRKYEYTASWIDCLATGANLGRGLFMGGNHDNMQDLPGHEIKPKTLGVVPIDAPAFLVNKLSFSMLNVAVYSSQIGKVSHKVVPYDGFFYPLDAIHDWNRVYGRPGFLQYQFVVPYNDNHRTFKKMLSKISVSGQYSFVTVLKNFGDLKSPGMLSFPRPGITLCLDFPNRGPKLFRLLDELDENVREMGGAVYPAKDARMSAKNFQTFFPRWKEFEQYIDPKFSSSFWRRVTVPVPGIVSASAVPAQAVPAATSLNGHVK